MTSPLNDGATRAFMQDNNCFGLSRRDIFMFPQGLLPSFDATTGKLLLADEGTVAMNPDGHGGSIKALAASGAIEDMAARYITEMRAVQPFGPYYLCGYSMGGWIAYEMAQQLLAAGQEVALLGIFDTSSRQGQRRASLGQWLGHHFGTMA